MPEFEQLSFEDPTALARCIKSDCQAYRAGNMPLCAQHLREQEVSAGATSIVEPDVEARMAKVRTEDDDHPGMVKIYDQETGKASWVAMGDVYVGPDPDVNGGYVDTVYPSGAIGTTIPDPTDLEPHWDGEKWILRAKHGPAVMACPHCGERLTVALS
jgi:hypothetical protein